jgi:hypothetical protein
MPVVENGSECFPLILFETPYRQTAPWISVFSGGGVEDTLVIIPNDWQIGIFEIESHEIIHCPKELLAVEVAAEYNDECPPALAGNEVNKCPEWYLVHIFGQFVGYYLGCEDFLETPTRPELFSGVERALL